VPVYQAVILGIVQGLTEFLPISSTAHLILVPALLGWRDPGLQFTVALHIGTLLAVLWYFRPDLADLTVAFFRSVVRPDLRNDPHQRLAWLIVVGSVPAGIAGLLFRHEIETTLRGTRVVAVALAAVAVLLFAGDRLAARAAPRGEPLGLLDAIVIGIAQACALIPGVSRSGATITAGLFRGLRRDEAARFSFLLGVPIILATAALEVVKGAPALLDGGGGGAGGDAAPIVAGILASTATGYLAIAGLLRFVRTNTFTVFVVYRLALAAGVLVYFR